MTRRKQHQKKGQKSRVGKKQGRQQQLAVQVPKNQKKQVKAEEPQLEEQDNQIDSFYAPLINQGEFEEEENEQEEDEEVSASIEEEESEVQVEADTNEDEQIEDDISISLRPQGSFLTASEAAIEPKEESQGPPPRLVYDRDFLLSFQSQYTERLPDMPSFESIYGTMSALPHRPRRRPPRPDRFEFQRRIPHEHGEKKPDRTMGTNRYEDREKEESNSWKPRRQMNLEADKENDSTQAKAWTPSRRRAANNDSEVILKEVKGTLNKLTEQNFDGLSIKIRDACKSAEVLKGVVDLIFSKALHEPAFAPLYARLCRVLDVSCSRFPQEEEEDEDEQEGEEDRPKLNFKKALLDKCQQNFEEREQREEAVTEEEANKERRSTIGNITFIGELYKETLLPDIVMHICVKSLLQPASLATSTTNNNSNNNNTLTEGKKRRITSDLEALCVLLTTIGAVFDKRKDSEIDKYFVQMKKLSTNGTIPSRVRCKVMDVCDLRASRWQTAKRG